MSDIDGKGNGRTGAIFLDALNWAFNILTALGTGYALVNQPNAARDIAALTSRLDGHEKANAEELAAHIREDVERDRATATIDAQKNINTAAVSELRAEAGAINRRLDREFHDQGNEISNVKADLVDLLKRIDPEPGGKAANIREIRAELADITKQFNTMSADRLRILDETDKRFTTDEQDLANLKRLADADARRFNKRSNDATLRRKGPAD